ncbi:MAG: hypothetical protein ACRD2I_09280 [Vicinamibacterales bacterium]
MVFSAIFAFSAVFSVDACGKAGPPLPPLVKLPVAPADVVALRRGNAVSVSFTVPAANTDGTRPANVASAEVYAITAPVTVPPLSDANLLKLGTKVGAVEVKAPRDPNLTADVDDPADEVEAPEGPGLDQGAVARLNESLTRDMMKAVVPPVDKHAPVAAAEPQRDAPLLGPPIAVPLRTYVAFGTSTRGRKGPLSRRVTVPLVPPPPPPSKLAMTYDEAAVSLTWSSAAPADAVADDDLLPSRAIGAARPAIAYHVYDSSRPEAVVRLTSTPVDATSYSDARVVFGEERCYTIVTAETIDGATIESEAAPPICETLVDTFPPAVPKDVKAISTEGAINLIWEPNAERDLAGYIVLRGVEPAHTLQPITAAPIVEPSFRDNVQSGIAYVYAVRAVDKAGNASDLSARVVETAR